MNSSQKSDQFGGRFLRNFSALVLVRGLGLLTPLIALPYILRVIGMENYGHVAFSVIVATFAGSIIQYGFPITAVKTIAVCHRTSGNVALSFWNNFYASLLIALSVSVAHLVLTLILPVFRAMLPVHVGAILMATGTALFPHWLFLGLEKNFYVAFSTLLVRFTHLGLIVLFVREPADFILVNFLGAVAAWFNVIIAIGLAIFHFGLRPTWVRIDKIIKIIQELFPAFLLQWSPNLYNSGSAILLGFYVGPATLGGFNAANSIITTVGALGQLLSNAFLPILSVSFDRHSLSAKILIFTGISTAVLTYLLAPYMAILLTDTGRDVIQQSIKYLSFSIPFLFVYLAFGHNYIALTEKRRVAGRITVITSLASLALSFFLIPQFGIVGFAVVMLLARGSMALVAFVLFQQHRRETGSPPITGH